ncbi:VOC family protein [Streptomyces sp. NPDC051218]|uniref:VOC family protein n=1 Tax=Streptomyces sp. NPDC051218 TaxID=3365645 RepID=UPI0037AAA5AE
MTSRLGSLNEFCWMDLKTRDNVDRRAEAATVNGARLVVPPFDAGDQGRVAALIDPVGAAFSLWQPRRFTGWKVPRIAGAPQRMILACDQPDKARHFYGQTNGTPPTSADFIATRGPGPSAPQWELAVDVDDLDSVVTRARDHGHGSVTWCEETDRRVVRLSSPEGLTFQVRRRGQ